MIGCWLGREDVGVPGLAIPEGGPVDPGSLGLEELMAPVGALEAVGMAIRLGG